MKNAISTWFDGFWNGRNPRERNMIAAATLVVVCGVTYVFLIDPALTGRQSLRAQLPELRQQAAELRALTRAAANVSPAAANESVTQSVAPVTRAQLDASLKQRAMNAQDLSVANEVVRVRFDDVSFSALTQWLREAQAEDRLTVIESKIEASESRDRVSAALSLRQNQNGQGG